MSYDEKQILDTYIKAVRLEINNIRRFAEKNGLLNEQIYIDFEDYMNGMSVMDPTDCIK